VGNARVQVPPPRTLLQGAAADTEATRHTHKCDGGKCKGASPNAAHSCTRDKQTNKKGQTTITRQHAHTNAVDKHTRTSRYNECKGASPTAAHASTRGRGGHRSHTAHTQGGKCKGASPNAAHACTREKQTKKDNINRARTRWKTPLHDNTHTQ
jgi:hypothetical protein